MSALYYCPQAYFEISACNLREHTPRTPSKVDFCHGQQLLLGLQRTILAPVLPEGITHDAISPGVLYRLMWHQGDGLSRWALTPMRKSVNAPGSWLQPAPVWQFRHLSPSLTSEGHEKILRLHRSSGNLVSNLTRIWVRNYSFEVWNMHKISYFRTSKRKIAIPLYFGK